MTRTVDVNYSYLRHYVQTLPRSTHLRVLDFGCGAGDVVTLLREVGIHAEGCDVFYVGGFTQESLQAQELMRAGHLRRIDEHSDLPYPPGTFDVILANMVFEHVQDLEAVLRRLRRILRMDGHILAHFPTKEVMKEGHIGIPFAHRLRRGSRWRYAYTLWLRRLGLGHFKEQSPNSSAWTARQLSWIDTYCYYRSMREVRRILAGTFEITFNEMQYMHFRAGARTWLHRLLDLPGAAPLACWVFRRLAFTAIVLRPAGGK